MMMKTDSCYHIPVLFLPCMEALNIHPQGTYVDVTLGGGGHSRGILERLEEGGHLFGFDQDADAFENAPQDSRFTFIRSNFRYLGNWMHYYGIDGVDGILADLGVSSHHFDTAERGFSFREDGPLDMRMNQDARISADDIVNQYSETQLTDILKWYGELRHARQMAKAIVQAREEQGGLHTTLSLQNAIGKHLNPAREKKEMAKVFQALRIAVNGELEALTEMLHAAIKILKPGGRLVVLSYHSLEDRIIKIIIRAGNVEGQVEKDFYGRPMAPLKALKQYPAEASEEEINENPRSRSARLRVAEKIDESTSFSNRQNQ